MAIDTFYALGGGAANDREEQEKPPLYSVQPKVSSMFLQSISVSRLNEVINKTTFR
jgi:hypothetical protein